jgi:thiol-disulfide isomerase/thioredoxin
MNLLLRDALRSILIGLAALFVALIGFEGFYHLIGRSDRAQYLFAGILIADLFFVIIAAARTAKAHAWWSGLLAGAAFGVPGFLIALRSIAPDIGTWRFMIGRPALVWWLALASILLITSLGTQCAAWVMGRRLFPALFAAMITVVGVVVIWKSGFVLARHIDAKTEAMKAIHVQQGFDMPLPDLMLTELNGKPISPTEFHGHVTVLDFWGTWCGACLAEMPSLEEVYKEYSGNPKVRFLLVNPQIEGDNPEKIEHFLKRKPMVIPVALNSSTSYWAMSSRLNNDALPLLVVVDQRGYIRSCIYGLDSGDKTIAQLHTSIDKLLTAN